MFLTGRELMGLNKLLMKPWFNLKVKTTFLMTVVLEIGIILHSIYTTDKWAGKRDIKKVSFKENQLQFIHILKDKKNQIPKNMSNLARST